MNTNKNETKTKKLNGKKSMASSLCNFWQLPDEIADSKSCRPDACWRWTLEVKEMERKWKKTSQWNNAHILVNTDACIQPRINQTMTTKKSKPNQQNSPKSQTKWNTTKKAITTNYWSFQLSLCTIKRNAAASLSWHQPGAFQIVALLLHCVSWCLATDWQPCMTKQTLLLESPGTHYSYWISLFITLTGNAAIVGQYIYMWWKTLHTLLFHPMPCKLRFSAEVWQQTPPKHDHSVLGVPLPLQY